MKYFFFFLLLVNLSYSQTGVIEYESNLNFSDSGLNEEKYNLYFTKNASLYQSELENGKITTNSEKSNSDTENTRQTEIYITVGSDSIGNTFYRDIHNETLICREGIYEDRKLKYYVYKDFVNLNWNLVAEFKDISGYKCQKATTKFRGRNYEAWFTSEIPLSFGPWKFGGLPGLILEIYDQTGEVYFSAKHIQIPYAAADKKVQKPKMDIILSHQDFVEKRNEKINEITRSVLARSPKGTKLVSTEVKRNGIELEYEWEKK